MTPEFRKGNVPEDVKRILMPSKEVIVLKLREGGFFGILPQIDTFYETFAGYIGGRNVPPGGFNLFWGIASLELSDLHAHLQVRLGVHHSFDRVIDAVVPDPEMASQAKEYRRGFLEAYQKEADREMGEAIDFLNSQF